MSKFRVGQRVRLARYPQGRENKFHLKLGEEGTVAGTPSCPNKGFTLARGSDLSVVMDSVGRPGMAPSYCFEPATDSYDVTTWDTCVWNPGHLRVDA